MHRNLICILRKKKFGYVPFPKTERANSLNVEVLPAFYECQWSWSKNATSFVQGFHAEGRRQYDHHSKLKDLLESFTSWKEHVPQDINDIKSNDLLSIKNRISQLKSFTEKLIKLHSPNLINFKLDKNVLTHSTRNA